MHSLISTESINNAAMSSLSPSCLKENDASLACIYDIPPYKDI